MLQRLLRTISVRSVDLGIYACRRCRLAFEFVSVSKELKRILTEGVWDATIPESHTGNQQRNAGPKMKKMKGLYSRVFSARHILHPVFSACAAYLPFCPAS